MADLAFVLSSGRTGTVFLTHLLERHAGAVCVHEPRGSRSNLMLANARNLLGPGTSVLRARFHRKLEERLASVPSGAAYIEVNPMLCALTDVLAEVRPLRLVHLTREPADWVRSIRAFRASTKFRPFIDHVPFANPYPVPRPAGWMGASRIERALWRWRYCNEQLLALAPRCDAYVRARYEDLFAADPAVRIETLRRIVAVLPIDAEPDASWLEREIRNPSPPVERVAVPPDQVAAICGPLLQTLGYEG